VSSESDIQKSPQIAGILLAGGASRRLGRPKQLVSYNGRPLVCHAARQTLAFCDAGLIVVTGAHHEAISAALDGQRVEVKFCSDWSEGIGASIRRGVASVGPGVGGFLLTVCDQPLITSEDIQNLVNTWRRDPQCIAAAGYAGINGVPTIFPGRLRGQLLRLHGDHGAKSIIDAADDTSVVPMPNAHFDVDTPDHLDRIEE
jgi:molybdenum cofactor cytidylyltransferase